MANFADVRDAIAAFHRTHKRPGIHDLPSRLTYVTFNSEDEWAQLWAAGGVLKKHGEDAGVYFFFDDNQNLRYIGSTNFLSRRLGQHGKRVTSNLAILPVPRDSWFEARAIESYLIQELQPPDNKAGIR